MVQANSDRSLSGINIAILATDGFELSELEQPRLALEQAGASARVISRRRGALQSCREDQPAPEQAEVDLIFDEADPQDFDAVLLPGGIRNAQRLRLLPEAQKFVQGMQEYGKPIAAVGNGVALLVSAGLVRGRSLTSWPALREEIGMAGGNWADRDVVVAGNLVTSRQPADLPAFCQALREVLTGKILASVHGTQDENLDIGPSS